MRCVLRPNNYITSKLFKSRYLYTIFQNTKYFSSTNNAIDKDEELDVIVDLCVVPLKGDNTTSVSNEIAQIQKMIDQANVKKLMHAYGTNIEGKWDDVFNLIKKIHYELHKENKIPRLSTTIKLGTRIDKQSSILGKIESVKKKL